MLAVIEELNRLAEDFKANFDKKGVNASGNTKRSVNVKTQDTDDKFIGSILVNKNVKWLDKPGRGPTRNRGGKRFTVSMITKWIQDKGIPVDNLQKASWAIYKKINLKGWVIPNRYNQGGLITDIFNEDAPDRFRDAIREEIRKFIRNGINFSK